MAEKRKVEAQSTAAWQAHLSVLNPQLVASHSEIVVFSSLWT